MKNIAGLVATLCLSSLLVPIAAGDANRGEQVLRAQGCTLCHSVNRHDGNGASDLGTRFSRNCSPAFLIGVIWNHAPSLWADLPRLQDATSVVSQDQAADLLAYFFSRRYFEPPGDARRGKKVFTEKHCAGCHGIRTPLSPDANPVLAWHSLRDPIAFAQAMWNRPHQVMLEAFSRKGIPYPRLTSQDLSDLALYLDNLPGIRSKEVQFDLASQDRGRTLFRTKGCASCHAAGLSRAAGASRFTIADVSAALWNHGLNSDTAFPSLSDEEMSALFSYLWSEDSGGSPGRGRHVFARKCAACHNNVRALAGPLIANEGQPVPVFMMSTLLNHGRVMYAQSNREGRSWPHFRGSEMDDLSAYLASQTLLVPAESTESGVNGIVTAPSRIGDYR